MPAIRLQAWSPLLALSVAAGMAGLLGGCVAYPAPPVYPAYGYGYGYAPRYDGGGGWHDHHGWYDRDRYYGGGGWGR